MLNPRSSSRYSSSARISSPTRAGYSGNSTGLSKADERLAFCLISTILIAKSKQAINNSYTITSPLERPIEFLTLSKLYGLTLDKETFIISRIVGINNNAVPSLKSFYRSEACMSSILIPVHSSTICFLVSTYELYIVARSNIKFYNKHTCALYWIQFRDLCLITTTGDYRRFWYFVLFTRNHCHCANHHGCKH